MPSLPRHIQPSFAAGELSPSLWGRTDLAKYHVGAAKMSNFFVHPEGGASNRQGTGFVGWYGDPYDTGSDYNTGTVLVPFEFSVEQAYVLVFLSQWVLDTSYMYILKDGQFVITSGVNSGPASTGIGDRWTASGAGSDLWYLNATGKVGGGVLQELFREFQVASKVYRNVLAAAVELDKTRLDVVTSESDTWGWGDLDTLGFNTVYVNAATNPDLDASGDWTIGFPVKVTVPFLPPEDPREIRYTQDANTLYMAHPNWNPYSLTRTADDVWTFTAMTFAPTVQPPSDLTTFFWGNYLAGNTEQIQYKVSQIDADTGEESLPTTLVSRSVNLPWQPRDRVSVVWNSAVISGTYTWSVEGGGEYSLDQPLTTEPDKVWENFGAGRVELTRATRPLAGNKTWDWASDTLYVHLDGGADPSAKGDGWVRWYVDGTEFAVYKSSRGYFGYVGTVQGAEFIDDNVNPDISDGPQEARDPFDGADDYPGAIGIFEQRLMFARTNNQPQTVWGSVTNNFDNLNVSSPLKDTDSIEATLSARQVNEIRHIVPLNSLLILTSAGEWLMAKGDGSDALTPTSVQFRVQGERGSNTVRPLVIGNSVLFAQRNSQTVRELAYAFEDDSYATTDVSVLSQHLFSGRTIVDWAYQQEPSQVVWAVMSDGKVLSFTYVKEQQVWAWAEHTLTAATDVPDPGGFRGAFKRALSVTSIPGDAEDDVYFATSNNHAKTYPDNANDDYSLGIEKLTSRTFNTVGEGVFCDLATTFGPETYEVGAMDATNPVALAITKLDSADDIFLKVGDHIYLEGIDTPTELDDVEVKIIGTSGGKWTLGEKDTGTAIDGTGFAAITGVARRAYRSIDTISEMDHLIDQDVVYQYDGTTGTGTVDSQGNITLAGRGHRIAVGRKITADLETLDMEMDTSPIKGRAKSTPRASLQLQNTKGGKIGSDVATLKEIRYHSTDTDATTGMVTTAVDTPVNRRWGKQGRLLIRQDEPLPITVAAIASELIVDDT